MQNKQTMELTPKEAALIIAIRTKYQYGEVLIECYQGQPHRIGRTTTYEKLEDKDIHKG